MFDNIGFKNGILVIVNVRPPCYFYCKNMYLMKYKFCSVSDSIGKTRQDFDHVARLADVAAVETRVVSVAIWTGPAISLLPIGNHNMCVSEVEEW